MDHSTLDKPCLSNGKRNTLETAQNLHRSSQVSVSFPEPNCFLLGNDQLDAQLLDFTIRLLCSSTCFEHYMLIIRRLNCINAASGIVTFSKWQSGAQVERELQSSSLSTCEPDSHLLRLNSGVPRGEGWGFKPPPPRNSEDKTKSNRIANWAENV